MYRITKFTNSCFRCECEIQDGTERWDETSKEKAIASIISAARVLNGSYIREDDIKFLEYQPSGIPRYDNSKDLQLLSEIKSGQKVVLDFNDKRIKYRLTDEECDWIIQRREGKLS